MPNILEKQGYKYTEEFGYIPEDWEVKKFEESFSFLQTNSVTRAELSDEGAVKNIHYGDILINYPNVLKYSEIKTYLNSNNPNNLKFVKNGDIIIADTAEDETVGKTVELQGLNDNEKVVSGMHTMFCRPKDENEFASGYLGYFINSNTYHNQLLPLITGIKVSSISKMGIKTTKIIIPDYTEQRKISEVLGDVDSLIDKTQQLINKKKDLKIATMQKLLTPREDWRFVELNTIVDFVIDNRGKTPPLANIGFPLFEIASLVNNKIDYSKVTKYVDKETYYNWFRNTLEDGDVLISTVGTTGAASYYSGKIKGAIAQNIIGLRFSKQNSLFMTYFLSSAHFNKSVKSIQMNQVQASVKVPQLLELKVKIPILVEQNKIATILSDMDSEIEALEKELNKYKDLKSGMMQQLLTGKVRLI